MIRKILVAILVACAISVFAVNLGSMPSAFAYPDSNVYTYPSTISFDQSNIGDQFNLTLNFGNMTDLFGFEFKLYWNNTMLSVLGASYTLPSTWSSPFIAKNWINQTLASEGNATLGRVWYSVTSMSGSFTGNMTFGTITLNVTAIPPDLTTWTSSIFWGPYGTETIFADSTATLITATAYNSEYMIVNTIPEFSPLIMMLVFAIATSIALVFVKKRN